MNKGLILLWIFTLYLYYTICISKRVWVSGWVSCLMLGQLLCCGLRIYLVIRAHVSLALCPNRPWRMWCYMRLPIAFWDNQQISLADSTECSIVGRITGKCCDIDTVFSIGPSINTPLRLKVDVPCLPVSAELPDIPCHIRHVSEVTISFEPLVDCLWLVLATKSVFLSLCHGFKSVTVSRIYVKVCTLPLGYPSISSNSSQSLIVCSQRGPSHIHSSALTHGAIHSGHFSQFGWVLIYEGPESRLLATLVVIARAVVIFGGLERGMEGGSWAAGGGEGDWVGIGGTDINEFAGRHLWVLGVPRGRKFTHISSGLKRLPIATCKSIAATDFLFQMML